MCTFIIKLAGEYLEWSSIVDAPVCYGMTLENFKAYYEVEHGHSKMDGLGARLLRVEERGTSARGFDNVDEMIYLNRAGPGEISLSKAEIIEWYVRRKATPTAEQIAARRRAMPKCDPCVHGSGYCCVCWGTGVRETAST